MNLDSNDTVTITESLKHLFQHTSKNPSDDPNITQMRNMSGTAKDTANSGLVKALQQALKALVAKALQ